MSSTAKVLVIGSPKGLVPENTWADFSSRYDVFLYEFPTVRDFHESMQSGFCSDIVGIVRLGLNIPSGVEKITQGWTMRALPYLPSSLKVIVNFGHGHDEEDISALQSRGIQFSNTTGGSEATAVVGLYLIISAFRQLGCYERMLRDGNFLPALRDSAKHSSDPFGKRLAIVGMGTIGQIVARQATAIGMEIHCIDRPNLRKIMAEDQKSQGRHLPNIHLHDGIESLVATADCVILTCSYSPSTHHVLSSEIFCKMKTGVRIVNISRGKCIDEEALCDAIERGIVGGAGLDVYYNE